MMALLPVVMCRCSSNVGFLLSVCKNRTKIWNGSSSGVGVIRLRRAVMIVHSLMMKAADAAADSSGGPTSSSSSTNEV